MGVQSGVGGHETLLVVAGERFLPCALELPEMLDLLWRRLPGGQPGGLRLEQGAHGEKLIGLGVGGHVDERAESRAQVNPTLALQALQRLPNWLPAYPGLSCQVVFELGLYRL